MLLTNDEQYEHVSRILQNLMSNDFGLQPTDLLPSTFCLRRRELAEADGAVFEALHEDGCIGRSLGLSLQLRVSSIYTYYIFLYLLWFVNVQVILQECWCQIAPYYFNIFHILSMFIYSADCTLERVAKKCLTAKTFVPVLIRPTRAHHVPLRPTLRGFGPQTATFQSWSANCIPYTMILN